MKAMHFLFMFYLCGILPLTLTGQSKPVDMVAASDTCVEEETKYELIVWEPGYEAYLVTQLPMEYYSVNYYKVWNRQYVTEWNIRFVSGPRRELFENEIYYDPMTNYGPELEYRLYHFFRFFEKKYDITLVYRWR